MMKLHIMQFPNLIRIYYTEISNMVTVKVKCTLVQALRLCTGHTAHRGSRDIALSFLDHGTRRGWGVSITPRLLFTPWKDPVPTVQEAGWAPGPVWTGAEIPPRIRSPEHPACSQSLYRPSYQPTKSQIWQNKNTKEKLPISSSVTWSYEKKLGNSIDPRPVQAPCLAVS
jgi:hypothetical protein